MKKLRIDWFLFVIAACLALFGAVMVYSASAMIALKETEGANLRIFTSSWVLRSPV